ncbi:hypothetical protein JCM10213v2_008722 [Rhodosporidiobolus nylandii]
MPGVFSPDHTLFVDPNRVSIEGRSSQLAAAALIFSKVYDYNVAEDKQNGGPRPYYLILQTIGSAAIALLREEAQLGTDDPGVTTTGEFVSIDLSEELEDVGLPTDFMTLDFVAGTSSTPQNNGPSYIQPRLLDQCRHRLRNIPGYTAADLESRSRQEDGSMLLVPRVETAHESLSWVNPFVKQYTAFEMRPSAVTGPYVEGHIPLPALGPRHAQPYPATGLNGSCILYFALRSLWLAKEPRRHPNPTEVPAHHCTSDHRSGVVAVQSFIILVLVETEMQADHHIDRNGRGNTGIPEHLRARAVGSWTKALLDDTVKYAFDVLVHHAGDDSPVDLRDFEDFQCWVLDIFGGPPRRGEPVRHPARELAEEVTDWLTRYWPRLQTRHELEHGRPEKDRVVVRFERAFARVRGLYAKHTVDNLLEAREAAARGQGAR